MQNLNLGAVSRIASVAVLLAATLAGGGGEAVRLWVRMAIFICL